MAVKLRLVRVGKKKQPSYRVVAADSRAPRNGRFIEVIGYYQPRQEPSVVKIDSTRAVHWLQHGAQPTERVKKLLKISGAWKEFRSPTTKSTATVTTTETATTAETAAPTKTAATTESNTETTTTTESATPTNRTETESGNTATIETESEKS